MSIQGNSKALKEINRKVILKKIRDYAPVSRTKLADYTNLSHPTVSTIIEELMNEEFIVEIGEGKSKGGRKPILIDFNNEKYYFISIDFAVDYVSVSLLNLKFEIIQTRSQKLFKTINEDFFIELITKFTYEMMNKLGKKEKILGMTIGVTGIISNSKDKIIYSAALNIKNLNVREKLTEIFDFPIYILNDANLSALAEKHFWSNISNYFYLFIGPSIGGGIIIKGDIYTGNYGGAGEIGHTIVEYDGPLCFCGKKGCLISVLSSFIPIDNTKELITTFNIIKKRGLYNSEQYRKFCIYLGLGISNYIKINDPELIIIGGDIIKVAPPRFYKDLEELVNEDLLSINKNIKIKPSSIKENPIILGGAYFCFEKVLL